MSFLCSPVSSRILSQRVLFNPHFLPVWIKDILTCPFLFCLIFFDCRLALTVLNFLGALRQTHQHLKGKQIISHYLSASFGFLLSSHYTTEVATVLPKTGQERVSSTCAVFILSLSNLVVGQLNSTATQLHQYSNLVIPWTLWHTIHLALTLGVWYPKPLWTITAENYTPLMV